MGSPLIAVLGGTAADGGGVHGRRSRSAGLRRRYGDFGGGEGSLYLGFIWGVMVVMVAGTGGRRRGWLGSGQLSG
ncbi:putative extensin [Iris pallida]|uniref:Extensin n=1 Tax=Iris pallida TaxID=29817 RepID=A0AAX6H5N2_IRIPA|nr:putative extensin [Iris pallida]KAJ6835861.1 putative extensin [Iris pallida]KAJ6853418.1 putative extensin [Iris pallida]